MCFSWLSMFSGKMRADLRSFLKGYCKLSRGFTIDKRLRDRLVYMLSPPSIVIYFPLFPYRDAIAVSTAPTKVCIRASSFSELRAALRDYRIGMIIRENEICLGNQWVMIVQFRGFCFIRFCCMG